MEDQLETTEIDQKFLDSNQYTHRNIVKYERIFGETYVSTGGEKTAQSVCELLPLNESSRVLDIGSGSAGPALFMARKYGCHVTGVDLSANMLALANERRLQLPDQVASKVQFIEADVTRLDFAAGSFNIIHSRDTLIHIGAKRALFVKLFQWLASGGHLVITDYCQRHSPPPSHQFVAYRQQRGYHLTSVEEYGKLLKSAGFGNVIALDRSQLFLNILQHELAEFERNKQQFIQEFDECDYEDIAGGWRNKIARVQEGSQRWALFQATK